MSKPLDLLQTAIEAQRRGDPASAERLCAEILTENPHEATAKLLLGMIAAQKGENVKATELLRGAVNDDPQHVDALNWLSNLLRRNGNLEEAVAAARNVLAIEPDNAEALFNLGAAELANGQAEAAAESLTRASQLRPNMPVTFFHLGVTLLSLGRNREAVDAFARAAELAPKLPSNQIGLGQAHLALHDRKAAKRCAFRALSLDPRSATANCLAAKALAEEEMLDEAIAYLKKALDIDPNFAEAHAYLGFYLQQLGRLDESRSHLRHAIDLDPKQAVAYYSLVQAETIESKSNPLVQAMESLRESSGLPVSSQYLLAYGLGKAHQDLQDFEAAMSRFDEANRFGHEIYRKDSPFDRTIFERSVTETLDLCDRDFLERSKGAGLDSNLPIFIVGMIRSGTTLVEQILSSHPRVSGAGEQNFWFEQIHRSLDPDSRCLKRVEADDLARQYCKLLDSKRTKGDHVTDKMPGAFVMLGLIYAHLPNARFIHVRRNPLDTCLSIWTTFISNPPEFGFDKGDIAFAYRQYLRAMEHWRRDMPKDRLLEIQYEELVNDPRREIGRMLDFCGLPWNEECLTPERNDRPVLTPSSWRVRQPIDGAATERWRRYEPWLGEFGTLLA